MDGLLSRLYQLGGLRRAAVVWVAFMVVLWSAFAGAALAYPDAFRGVEPAERVDSMAGLALFLYISVMNGMILLLIAGGNLFARFGWVTPGLIVLLLQGVQIGWMAGSNAFEFPFPSMAAANLAFLRVGLWETSACALICAVTLPHPLLISETFPPRAWSETRKLSDLRLGHQETVVLFLAIAMWLGAAVSEAVALR
jgi:hypothetical protein